MECPFCLSVCFRVTVKMAKSVEIKIYGKCHPLPSPMPCGSLSDRLIVDIVYICASISIRFECFRCCEWARVWELAPSVLYASSCVYRVHVQLAGESTYTAHSAVWERARSLSVCDGCMFVQLTTWQKMCVFGISLSLLCCNFICFYLFIILWGCHFVWVLYMFYMFHLPAKVH